jgi:hypothetical protein
MIASCAAETASGVLRFDGSRVELGELPCWIRLAWFWSAVASVCSADDCAA